MCRSGFYQYEHIEPFTDVQEHDPDRICCLCAACHDRVTRGQLSKKAVENAYRDVWAYSSDCIPPPRGPLDFHTGSAHLVIGGLRYSPLIKSVLRYHGEDLFYIEPGEDGKPGAISAVFFDDNGQPVFQLAENEWIGEPGNWDIEVVGRRLRVRNPDKKVVLALRLEPPGTVVIECLDMRCADAHVLISEHSYALGRYLDDDSVMWMFADMAITRAVPEAAIGLEFAAVEDLQERARLFGNVGQSLSTGDGNFIFGSPLGVICIPLGISVGHATSFNLGPFAFKPIPLAKVRRLVQRDPEGLIAAFRNT